MITRPFNLQAHVRQPGKGLDVVPFVDLGVIALFFIVFSSRFVFAPGIALDLPTTRAEVSEAAPAAHVLTVIETEGSEVVIFERGGVLTLDAFEELLRRRGESYAGEVLLVRADRDVSLQLLARVWEIAVDGGFSRVLLAAEPEEGVPTGF